MTDDPHPVPHAGPGHRHLRDDRRRHLQLSGPGATPTETKEQPTRNEGARPAHALDACRFAAWPQIPAECMKSDNEGRARRAVRVIPIHSAGAN